MKFTDGTYMIGSKHKEETLQAINISGGDTLVARHVAWAGTSPQRRKGLLGYSKLDPDEAMYLAPCQWIHTFRMQFPIDVAFLAKDGRVLSIHHSLKPNRISKLIFRAEGVLELSAGRLRETNTKIGDVIVFQDAGNPSQEN
jgi:uncharacterized membrane protein (UPF0127 family)